ncbi:MAG: methenyltetrahydromethanopterin cyclohydrolase [Propylenella sp.]
MQSLNLNSHASRLADDMVHVSASLRIGVSRGARGEILIDCGAKFPGGIEAGLRMARICMGGLGTVRLIPSEALPRWPWRIAVHTSQPVAACLASQYAGWALKHESGGRNFSALGSGPARALARREAIFADLPYREDADRAVLVLESEVAPPPAILEKVAGDCGVAAERLTVLYAPIRSLAGVVQVVARVVEVALHKAHALKFPLDRILDAAGSAPLSPPHPDLATGMGRTNDTIIFGGEVRLFVSGPADEAKALAEELPSTRSRDYGAPFAEIFKRFGGDFYAIDPMLFSPAAVTVTALDNGETFRAGKISAELLDASFR